MSRTDSRAVVLATLLVVMCPLAADARAEETDSAAASYFRDVWPIVQQRCQGCHQPAFREAELDLTTYAGLIAGGENGPSLAPGDPDESTLFLHLTGEFEPKMPNEGDPLTDEELELFRSWIAAGAEDDTPEDLAGLAPGAEPVYHRPPVITALAYSPDGRWLAVSGYREILLHRADGSGLEARLVGLSDRIQSLAFTPDSRRVVAGGGTPARFGEMQVWDLASRELVRAATVCYDTLFGASLSPDGERLAFGCADHTMRVFQLERGEELLRANHHENWVLGTIFGGDGQRIVSVGRDRAAKLTDAKSGAFVENVNQLRGELAAIVRHPNRDAVVIGGEDRVPYYYMMDRPRKRMIRDDSTLIREFERQDGEIFALAISPDGQRLAVAGNSGGVPIYDLESGERQGEARGHQAGIYTLAFSPDGSRLATAGFDGRVRLYDVSDATLVHEMVPVPIEERPVRSANTDREARP